MTFNGPLGLALVNAPGSGTMVKEVVAGGAGERAGVPVGAVLVQLNDRDIEHKPKDDVIDLIKATPMPRIVSFRPPHRTLFQANAATGIKLQLDDAGVARAVRTR